MKNEEDLLIIDGYGFVFRAYHVQPLLTSPDGKSSGAIYGFTNMLMKILQQFKPKFAVVVLDSGGKNFRHQIYSEYKANRPPIAEDLRYQLPIVREAAESLNFVVMEKQGFEADDIIATLANKVVNKGKKAVIISSDKDLMQLMDDRIRVYDPMKAKYISAEDVVEKFGVMPNKLREVMALIGDKSDNIPGVPGIGPKNAAMLIEQFGSVANIFKSINEITNQKQRNKIENSEDIAILSWKLVALDCNVDIDLELDKLEWTPPSTEKISNFLANYGFKSLYKRAENLFQLKIKPDSITTNTQNIKIIEEVSNKKDLVILLENARYHGYLSLYIVENDSNQPIMILSVDNEKIYIVHLKNKSDDNEIGDLFSYNSSVKKSEYQLLNIIIPYLQNKAILKITTNLKILYNFLTKELGKEQALIALQNCQDLELMQYLLSAGLPKKDFLNIDKKASQADIMAELPYIVSTFRQNYNQLLSELRDNNILHLYSDIDLPLLHVIYQMEQNGIKVDSISLKELSKKFIVEISKLEEEIFSICGTRFNISSTKQLGEILFEKMQLPFGKLSAKSKNYTTDVEILEKLSENGHHIADLLLRWRSLTKLQNTYTDGLQPHINVDSRVRSTFLQTSTSTARLSSQNPNLQNIPIRSEEGNKIRACFIAASDHQLISADYSQIELRILSHIANVISLKQAFIKNIDIHSLTAANIFKLEISELTSEHRRKAKAINFGIIYGISAFGLAKQLGISSSEAANYIKKYFTEYPEIQKYMEDTKNYARSNGYVKNLFGRKCFVQGINDTNNNIRQFAERAAINAPIQGTNADIIRIAMVDIHNIIKKQRLRTKLVLQIHDELVFEVPEDEIETISPIIQKTMEKASPLDIPTIVDIKCNHNWMKK